MISPSKFGNNHYQYPEPQAISQPSAMTISPTGLSALRAREPLELSAVETPEGQMRIGYGHVGGIHRGEQIDIPQAKLLLLADCAIAHLQICVAITVPMTQSEYDALVSFAYSVDAHQFSRSDVVRQIQAQNVRYAADSLLTWSKHDGEHNAYLFKRRKSEAAQMLNLPW